MRRQFLPAQLAAFRQFKSSRTAAFFMYMRRGKTLAAIRWANSRPTSGPILVICAKGVMLGWDDELRTENRVLVRLVGTPEQRLNTALTADTKWFAINPEAISRGKAGKPQPAITDMNWSIIILDESRDFANAKSSRTKCVLKHLSKFHYKAILSGLPNPEGAHEMVTQFIFLHGEFMGCKSFWEWRKKYMIPDGYIWQLGHKNLVATNAEARRLSYIAGPEKSSIPERTRRGVKLPEHILAEIYKAEHDLEAAEKLTNYAVEGLLWVLQLAGGRFPDKRFHHNTKLHELLLAYNDLPKPVIVWARFTAEIEAIIEYLRKHKLRCRGMYKKTGTDEPIKALRKGKVDALVCQALVGGKGADLSAARSCVFLSNHFSYNLREQSEQRLCHPTKTERPQVVDIVAEDTYDDDLSSVFLVDKRLLSKTLWGEVRAARQRRLLCKHV